MRKVTDKIKSRWRRFSRITQITLLVLVVLVVALRLGLPYIVKSYVNHQLNKSPEYRGHVERGSIALFRGAYTIKDLKLEKYNGKVPVPFIVIPTMDLSVQWKELFHGSVVGAVERKGAQGSFVNGPTKEQQQTGANAKDLKQILESLFPFRINRFIVDNGDLRFRDFNRNPQVDIYITNLFAVATNLTNARDVKGQLPAGLIAGGTTIGGGKLALEIHMNPLADKPTFKLSAGITNMDLTALNNFMQAYGKFDVQSGTFEVYTEIAGADGHFDGYVKPFFENLDVFDWDKERKKNILEQFWQAIVAGVAQILKNQPHNRLATKVPISGDFEKTDIDLWTTVGG